MRLVILAAALFSLAGCGGDSDGLVPTKGTVTVDGAPATQTTVAFIPIETTGGNGGTALTDSSGQFEILTPQGKKGLLPGKYKVTISRRLNPDGSLPDVNVPPMESSATESLPARFTERDRTELRATVEPGKTHEFAVNSLKKK